MMNRIKKYKIILCCLAVISVHQIAFASQSQGTISADFRLTRICKNADCSTYGNVNWKPTLNANTQGATAVSITDTLISGYLWGDEIGWINMQPASNGVIVNPNTGELSGYAYSNSGSWVNFSPTDVSGGTNVGVSINSSGQFAGWAYVSGINGGWMKFDCNNASTCIKTDWRPIPARTGEAGGGGGSEPIPEPEMPQPVADSGMSGSSGGRKHPWIALNVPETRSKPTLNANTNYVAPEIYQTGLGQIVSTETNIATSVPAVISRSKDNNFKPETQAPAKQESQLAIDTESDFSRVKFNQLKLFGLIAAPLLLLVGFLLWAYRKLNLN